MELHKLIGITNGILPSNVSSFLWQLTHSKMKVTEHQVKLHETGEMFVTTKKWTCKTLWTDRSSRAAPAVLIERLFFEVRPVTRTSRDESSQWASFQTSSAAHWFWRSACSRKSPCEPTVEKDAQPAGHGAVSVGWPFPRIRGDTNKEALLKH